LEAGSRFAELIASRREWIEAVLKPWLRGASRRDLLAAEQEWVDIAGRADPQKTLWPWAWSRFPVLFVDDLGGLEESYRVTVTLRDGSQHTGYPDARRSLRGELVLLGESTGRGLRDLGPWSIDEIHSVERCKPIGINRLPNRVERNGCWCPVRDIVGRSTGVSR
jgi:hypothetical protein